MWPSRRPRFDRCVRVDLWTAGAVLKVLRAGKRDNATVAGGLFYLMAARLAITAVRSCGSTGLGTWT